MSEENTPQTIIEITESLPEIMTSLGLLLYKITGEKVKFFFMAYEEDSSVLGAMEDSKPQIIRQLGIATAQIADELIEDEEKTIQ